MTEFNWGITPDLQADVRFEPNACQLYTMDLSLGCPFHCVYCLFSPLEKRVYKIYNPAYNGEVIPLQLDKFMARKSEDMPAGIYLSYTSDPLGNEAIRRSAVKVLERLLESGTVVWLASKGIFSDEILDVIRTRPELMEVQVGITSRDDLRNRVIEPQAPPYAERLQNLEKLSRIENLGSLGIRIDPLFPGIDDNEENIGGIVDDIRGLGVEEVIISYLLLTREMKATLVKNAYLRKSVTALSEITPTISGHEVFCMPFELRRDKLVRFYELCLEKGAQMRLCGCKEERFKGGNIPWFCHPFNEERKRELFGDTLPVVS